MGAMISRSEFRRINERRLDLIDKKYSVGLTDAEAAQLDTLKARVGEWVQIKFPRDASALDEASARLAELKAKVARRKMDQTIIDNETA